jgi:hypothetical protein
MGREIAVTWPTFDGLGILNATANRLRDNLCGKRADSRDRNVAPQTAG